MDKSLEGALASFAKPHGFASKSGAYFRIKNDMVQGFVLKRKRNLNIMLYSIGFASYPLCNPYALYYQLFFDRRNISFLNQTFSLWPFYVQMGNNKSRVECGTNMLKWLENYLIPYFDRYKTCAIAAQGLPEISDAFTGIYDYIFIQLKAGNTVSARQSLVKMIEQRKRAYERNKLELSEELVAQMASRTAEKNKVTLELMAFIDKASDQQIDEYLLHNEIKGRNYLKM